MMAPAQVQVNNHFGGFPEPGSDAEEEARPALPMMHGRVSARPTATFGTGEIGPPEYDAAVTEGWWALFLPWRKELQGRA